MEKIPFDIGAIHIIGIGGIGMSGIAEILHQQGYTVQGSDMKESANTKRLADKGIKIYLGHDKAHVENASIIVVSSAIKQSNPEWQAAEAKNIPIIKRADMLAEILRMKWSIGITGTHGKTTTTSLVGAMLEQAGIDPTIINGGIINAYGTNTRLGQSNWLVAEADESDGTITKLTCSIACITNIDPEHLDHYGDFDQLKEAYKTFIRNIPFFGFAVACIDHGEVAALIEEIKDKKIITYGFDERADYRAFNLRHEKDTILFDVKTKNRKLIENIRLPMMGDHNVQNAIVACAIADQLNVPADVIASGFSKFGGVKRRFTHVDRVAGLDIIDDYAHHPVEIRAVLNAARKARLENKIIAVMQPHRYSRLQSLFDDFARAFQDADHVFIAPVYAAGEEPLDKIDHAHLVEAIKKSGHENVAVIDEKNEDLAKLVLDIAAPDDIIIFMGAGDITARAYDFPNHLRSLHNNLTAAKTA